MAWMYLMEDVEKTGVPACLGRDPDGKVILSRGDLWILASPEASLPPTPIPSSVAKPAPSGLSPGAVAGIAVGFALVAIVVVTELVLVVKREHEKKKATMATKQQSAEGTIIAIAPAETTEIAVESSQIAVEPVEAAIPVAAHESHHHHHHHCHHTKRVLDEEEGAVRFS